MTFPDIWQLLDKLFIYKKNNNLFAMCIYYFFTREPVKHCTPDKQIAGATPGSCRLSVHCLPVPPIWADSY